MVHPRDIFEFLLSCKSLSRTLGSKSLNWALSAAVVASFSLQDLPTEKISTPEFVFQYVQVLNQIDDNPQKVEVLLRDIIVIALQENKTLIGSLMKENIVPLLLYRLARESYPPELLPTDLPYKLLAILDDPLDKPVPTLTLRALLQLVLHSDPPQWRGNQSIASFSQLIIANLFSSFLPSRYVSLLMLKLWLGASESDAERQHFRNISLPSSYLTTLAVLPQANPISTLKADLQSLDDHLIRILRIQLAIVEEALKMGFTFTSSSVDALAPVFEQIISYLSQLYKRCKTNKYYNFDWQNVRQFPLISQRMTRLLNIMTGDKPSQVEAKDKKTEGEGEKKEKGRKKKEKHVQFEDLSPYLDRLTMDCFAKIHTILHILASADDSTSAAEITILCHAIQPPFPCNLLSDALFLAVRHQALSPVKALLEAGADPNIAEWDDTALTSAAGCGNIPIMEALLDAGASVNTGREMMDSTPLLVAIDAGHTDAVRFLLEHGADPQIHTRYQDPLALASAHGNLDVVKLLLSRGVDPNSTVLYMRGPLHSAVEYGHLSVIEALLTSGADIEQVDDQEWSPLHLACFCGQSKAALLLLQHGAKMEAALTHGFTELHLAAVCGDIQRAATLLEEGAIDVNAGDEYNRSPLFFAVKANQPDMVDFFLAHGADVNQVGHETTALSVASEKGYTSLVEKLLHSNADPNKQNDSQQVPLHCAAEHGHAAVVEMLLQHGASIDAPDHIGRPPLSTACIHGQLDVVKVLLDHGADINVGSIGQSEPLSPPLLEAIYDNHADVAELLLSRGADVHNKNPLDYAILKRSRTLVSLLIKYGALADSPDKTQETAGN